MPRLTARALAEREGVSLSELQRAARRRGRSLADGTIEISAGLAEQLSAQLAEDRSARAAEEAIAEARARAAREAAERPPERPSRPTVGLREVATARGRGRKRLRVHPELWEWLHDPEVAEAQRRRASLVFRHMLANGRPNVVKPVRGAGAGWLRTPLGGNGGRQFYLWYVTGALPPADGLGLTDDDLLVRTVRHHDEIETAPSLGDPADYVVVEPRELIADYPDPFTEPQRRLASSAEPVRTLRGQPGCGKTTALWLAASTVRGRRALYLTFSRRLAREARDYLATFGPEGVDFDVRTFGELVADLAPAPGPAAPAARRVGEAVAGLEAWLAAQHRRPLGPWDARVHALYGELHAHLVGGASPIALPERDWTATALGHLEPEVYRARRGPEIGDVAARAAAEVGRRMLELAALPALFPELDRAARALQRLRAGGELPAELRDLDWIFVDEVQDLTVLEASVVIELAVSGANATRTPGLVLAGDESQTVRATDFSWGVLDDLLHARVAPPEKAELSENLRAPQELAAVNGQGLYRALDRQERPRGQVAAEVAESTAGRILWCVCEREAELERVLGAVREHHSAAVVYPDAVVPPELRPHGVEPSAAVKGLDFQTVAVVDVGARALSCRALADDGDRLRQSWARTIADHVRVALSRATETLVLVERSADRARSEAVRGLARAGNEVELILQAAETVIEELAQEAGDRTTRVLELVEAAEPLILDTPERALELARRAVANLARPSAPGAVTDPHLRGRTQLLRGLAALGAARTTADDSTAAELYREANRALHAAGRTNAARAALALRDLAAIGGASKTSPFQRAEELLERYDAVRAEVPELESDLRRAFLSWLRWAAAEPAPAERLDRNRLERLALELPRRLGMDAEEAGRLGLELRARLAERWLEDGEATTALALAEAIGEARPLLLARCLEAGGQHERAARIFERVARPEDALRCWREAGALDAALALCASAGIDCPPALTAQRALREALRAATPSREDWTAAERAGVWRAIEASLGPAPRHAGGTRRRNKTGRGSS